MKKHIATCHICGREEERTIKYPKSTCYECKMKKLKESNNLKKVLHSMDYAGSMK